MSLEGRPSWCDDGLKTTNAAKYLSIRGVCEEPLCIYEDRATVRTHCAAGPDLVAQQQAIYGISSYSLIDNIGLNGPSIANTDYLEAILCKGLDIVLGTNVAWGDPEPDGVLDIILDEFGNPLASRGGHAMLIVGYNRGENHRPYFILKNSWGVTRGHAGYYWLSYDYMRQYAKYGYVVHTDRMNMPLDA